MHDRTSERPFSSFFLHSASGQSPLRVGLVLDSFRPKAWQVGVIEDILSSDFAAIELLIMNSPGPEPSRRYRSPAYRLLSAALDPDRRNGLAWELYQVLDRRRVSIRVDPMATEDALGLLAGIPIVHVQPITKRFVRRLEEEDLEAIQRADLHVILHFGIDIVRGGILDASRYGLWSFHHGDIDRYRGGPAGFWEMVEGSPVTGAVLQRLTNEWDAPEILAKGLFATDPSSVIRNCAQPCFGSAHLVIQKLRELHEQGWERLIERSPAPKAYEGRRQIYRRPSNLELTRWVAPRLVRSLAARAGRSLGIRDDIAHWRIAVRTEAQGSLVSQQGDMSGFRWLESPPGRFFADPFLLERDGRTWLFFEDYSYAERRGVISCAEVRADGTLGPIVVVLSTRAHLSYPCLVKDGPDVYMIPESAASGGVQLFKAADFPYAWTPVTTVYAAASAVDTTVWHDERGWWFFTTLREPRGNSPALFLFHSDALTGSWESHPMNPISLDVRTARCAGAIFRDGGRLIRPSQDCSRDYGYSFTLNEITMLTSREFAERPLLTVGPDWAPGLCGTHSYALSGTTEATDGKVPRARRAVLVGP